MKKLLEKYREWRKERKRIFAERSKHHVCQFCDEPPGCEIYAGFICNDCGSDIKYIDTIFKCTNSLCGIENKFPSKMKRNLKGKTPAACCDRNFTTCFKKSGINIVQYN